MAPDSDWERPPYYVKGLVALAYTLNDPGLIEKAQKWINAAIGSQQASGAFGPAWNVFDWWPRMPMLYAVKDFYEATGDSRVIPFLTNYFRFQSVNVAAHPVSSWAKARVGDNIDVVLWLYNRTGDAFLLDLADTLRRQGFDFTDMLANNKFSLDSHGVNVAQYMKTPSIVYQRSGSAADRGAFVAGSNHLARDHGQVIGMPSGTEALAGRSSIEGVELCATVERMQSNEQAQMIVGDPAIGDQLELIAFNALPGAMDKANRLHQYYILPNQYQSVKGRTSFRDDHGQDLPPSPMSGYPCCRFNLHMGWAYYVKNMWAATSDDGIAAMAYGPSRVTTRLRNTDVTITESTSYPFEDQIRLTVQASAPVAFPLKLRIPAWAAGPSVRVNGAVQNGVRAGTFFTVNRTWNSGDTVTVVVPMRLEATTQLNNSMAIRRGPLVFSLKITERWQQTASFANGFGEFEVRPGSAWNYGLVLDRANPDRSISVRTAAMPSNPFVADTTPITLTANARRVGWGTVDNGVRVAEVPRSPLPAAGPIERITLVPFGAQNIRMTYFPEVTPGVAFRIQNQHSGKVLGVDQMSTANSARVVQFSDTGTADHLWQILDNGDGWVRIQNVHSGKVLGVDGMSTADSAQVVQFDDAGTADHLWQILENDNGYVRIMNKNSGKVLAVSGMSTADSANVVQFSDVRTADHNWRFIPDGTVRLQAVHSNQVLAIDGMSTSNGAQLTQFPPIGSADHVWRFEDAGSGYFRIVSNHSGKCVDISGISTADGAKAVQWDYVGGSNQQWRLAWRAPNVFALVARHSGKVLEVQGQSTADGAHVGQYPDLKLGNQRWRIMSSS